jgi:hypothetical protein
MPSPACPACRTNLTFFQVLRAPTPFHLRCGGCRARLSTHPALEWSAMLVAVVGGIYGGYLVATRGLPASYPVFGTVLALELAAALAMATVGKVEVRK